MKVIKLSSVTALLFTTAAMSAQVFVDAENASINGSGHLRDNGRTLLVQKEGNGLVNPWITGFKRSGAKGIGFRINGTNSGTKQRVEYPIIRWTSPQNVADGANRYTGFSIFLSNDVWDTPTSWFVIHQIQQVAVNGQTGNFPFIALEVTGGNNLRIIARSGKNGNTVRNPSQKVNIKFVRNLKKGRWYDIVVGWRFRPNNNDGWVNVWHKEKNQNKYARTGIGNIRVGYWQPAKRILNNKIGIYRGRVTGSNKMYFDEVRWAGYLGGARIPGSSAKTLEDIADFDSTRPLPSNLTVNQNPVVGDIVSLNVNGKSDNESTASIKVYDTNGRELSNIDAGKLEPGNNKLNFDLETLKIGAPGMYLLKLETNNTVHTKKIIIE